MMAQDERWQRRQMLTLTLGFTVRNIVAFIFKFAVPLLSGILVGTILK
jgi:accessory gene regulator protein AgrB